jgi:hypothetical protein
VCNVSLYNVKEEMQKFAVAAGCTRKDKLFLPEFFFKIGVGSRRFLAPLPVLHILDFCTLFAESHNKGKLTQPPLIRYL